MADDATPAIPPTSDAADSAAEDPTPAGSPATPDPVVIDEVTAKLTELGVDDATILRIKSELGVASVDDLGMLAEKDFLSVDLKVVQARKLVAAFI
jgi:hypothetical protein